MVTITYIYYTFLTETPPVLVKNGKKCRYIYIYISVAKPKGRFAEKEKVSQEGAIVKER